jgi:hypothetical protein
LQNLFRTSITRRGYKESDIYDWEKETEDEQNINAPPPQQQQQQQQQGLSSINNKVSAYVHQNISISSSSFFDF